MPEFETPAQRWEQALIDDYYDYRWQQLYEPIYHEMKRCNEGEITEQELNKILGQAHQERDRLQRFYEENRELLVPMIELDQTWFTAYLAEHPAPAGVKLRKPPAQS